MTRYDPVGVTHDPDATVEVSMEESRTGEYVRYDDVAALVKSLEGLLEDYTDNVEREFRSV